MRLNGYNTNRANQKQVFEKPMHRYIKKEKKMERYEEGKKVLWLSILLNFVLTVLKIGVGIIGSSQAILADGIHTLTDVASSIGLIFGLHVAAKPEDKEHPYGHEKAESIATFLLSIILIAVGLNIGYGAIKSLISGTEGVPSIWAVYVAILSIIIKEMQFQLSYRKGKAIKSDALIADAWHHRSDALSSIGALIGVVGARFGFAAADPIAGAMVSLIVIKVGLEIFFKTYNELMDMSIDEEKISEIKTRIKSHGRVESLREIKARKHGSVVYLDVIITVNPDMSVSEGHQIAEDVECIIRAHVCSVKDVMVHVEPENELEKQGIKIKKQM